MVRGRRPRAVTQTTVRSLEDQFAASPKRKDCKLDPQLSPRRPTTPISPHCGVITSNMKSPEFHGFHSSSNNNNNNKTPTRSRAITHYFPFAHKIDGEDSGCNVPAATTAAAIAAAAAAGADHLAVYDENACDAYDLHNLPDDDDDDEHEHASGNIFLQAPVLHLNIDRSPNQPSSITINKHIEVMSNFAALTATAVNCHDDEMLAGDGGVQAGGVNINSHRHGGAGSVAGSETDRSDDDGHVTRSPSCVSAPESSDYISSDSNSCDSGVVADRHKQQQQQQQHPQTPQPPQQHQQLHQLSPKRRKPMTPHRIVCPSPDKRPEDLVANDETVQQPQQQQQSPSSALSGLKIVGLKNPKTRRQLNVNKRTTKAAKKSTAATTRAKHENIATTTAETVADTDTIIDVITVEDDDDISPTAGDQTEQNFNNNNNNNHNNYKTPAQAAEQIKPPFTATERSAEQNSHATTAKTKIADVAAVVKPKAQLTDFFPVRRSVRKTKKVVELEQQRYIEMAIRNQQEDGLQVAEFPHKGRGIMASRRFERGEFVIEYIGDLIDMPEANRREQLYAKDENTGCYMYYFKHAGQQYCIDATAESGKLGRLVNHSRNGNLVTKTLFYGNRPHLVLLAKDCVEVGEELTYDYGDRSKESLLHHPWLAL